MKLLNHTSAPAVIKHEFVFETTVGKVLYKEWLETDPLPDHVGLIKSTVEILEGEQLDTEALDNLQLDIHNWLDTNEKYMAKTNRDEDTL